MNPPQLSPLLAAFAAVVGTVSPSNAQVVINEFSASHSERLTMPGEDGQPRLGCTPAWYDPEFIPIGWAEGPGPFGFGYPVATNLQSLMRNSLTSLYLRKTFTVSGHESGDAIVKLVADYDDGFVAYLNGTEVARRNMGPAGLFAYHDHQAFNKKLSTSHPTPALEALPPETIELGPASGLLVEGPNLIAIQVHNLSITDPQFFASFQLHIGDNPEPVVGTGDSWAYFIGHYEPAGGVYDPATILGLEFPDSQEAPKREFVDWLELYNPTGQPVSLAGWSLSDRLDQPNRWTFPEGAVIPANGYLLIACDGVSVTNPPSGGLFHTNFRLGASNGAIALFHPDGSLADAVTNYPPQDPFHSYGRDAASAQFRYFRKATPGGPNAQGIAFAKAAPPEASHETGFYDSDFTLTLTAPDPQATIRFTTDGSEPTETNGLLYTGPLNVLSLAHLTPGQPGGLLREVWHGIPGTATTAVPAGTPPSFYGYVRSAESPNGYGDNYGTRLSGWLVPPVTGEYTFWISSDESSELWISTDNSEANRALVASVPGRTGYRAWDTYPVQQSAPISLISGKRYYLEVLHKEATSNDHVSVAWRRPDAPSGTAPEIIPGTVLIPASPPSHVPALQSGVVLRVRAFSADHLPSDSIYRTYLFDVDPRLRTLPAVLLNADTRESMYAPRGVLAIHGGYFSDVAAGPTVDIQWRPTRYVDGLVQRDDPAYPTDLVNSYNMALRAGRPVERFGELELLEPDNSLTHRQGIGFRLAGSSHARLHYQFVGIETSSPWNDSFVNKPSFTFYFRSDYPGGGILNLPLFPESRVSTFTQLRNRAGKNDAFNPFIKDELVRRLSHDMGQPALLGRMVNFFINGTYKGYYNLTARGREDWLREYFSSTLDWDIRQVREIESGDAIRHDADMAFLDSLDDENSDGGKAVTTAEFMEAATRFDLVNYTDYILLNAYCGTGDWPQNNFIVARERSPDARWIWLVWDAEGAFGGFSKHVEYNVFGTNLLEPLYYIHMTCRPYAVLRFNPDFRLLFADRIQKHFFRNGALTEENIYRRFEALRDEMNPTMTAVRGVPVSESFLRIWRNGQPTADPPRSPRREAFFRHLEDPDEDGSPADRIWPPAVFAPEVAVADGKISLSHEEPGVTIYYTIDGTDPRLPGGAVSPAALVYAGPFAAPYQVRARARKGEEWSPIEESVHPEAIRLAITEIHYNPSGPDELTEFVEVMNTGSWTVQMEGIRFAEGVDFVFPARLLAPGERLLIVRDIDAFRAAYPSVPPGQIAGAFSNGTGLSNSGETLTLIHPSGLTLFQVSYSDRDSWPAEADGGGYSLVLRRPDLVSSGSDARDWRLSAAPGGNPGVEDSAPIPDPPDGDADQDGLSGLLEYALGTSDTDPESGRDALPVLRDGRLIWQAAVNADHATVIVEATEDPDGGVWEPLPVAPVRQLVEGGGRWQFEAAASIPAHAERWFLRLRVVLDSGTN